MIPYGRQDVTAADIDAVTEVLRSPFLTQGPAVPRFENAISAYTGAQYAVAVNSATSALHIACLALGLGPGDRLWTTPVTFVASANCGLYCGASVDFVDIDPATCNMSPQALRIKLERAREQAALPKVVVPVDLCGHPCDMAEIRALADEYGFRIIEDASHAVGARYRGKPVGCGDYADITVFSFHPVKIVTTAEGGVAVTNDATLAQRMAMLRSHGITRDQGAMSEPSHGPWYYEQIELGYNYRMTELQAALGASQLERLDAYVERRHDLARRYDRLLDGLPVRTPTRLDEGYSSLHLYVIRLVLDEHRTVSGCTHREVFEALREAGIGVNLHYIPVHIHPYYRKLGFRYGDFPASEQYYREAISLPLFATLKETEQDQIIDALWAVLMPSGTRSTSIGAGAGDSV
ncbi:UDP-4-amino-4,6-dideoxy-N-acetyl-beta-L-altrosamine transaminase [Trinickia symbiotica]|uniref:UDP-4-amino-4, 6-dideoxy-N-acetyl-beta-L-altrosamine transaminase n=1 Tax=Trinickia symbiotica TaxID=863227 RepID=A0A2T3XNJ7_9BURK|nr:UDP-4-amino-4,6-dideoxy-N-acetyl-beta-L-altrosamine transaminase [Trinickia symbiotica]PTB18084.1 UDP-4-amino-4,6-dideoxy-N-acetyl-beta-L-altrosamine transaminase [Trinickia symbiotica]